MDLDSGGRRNVEVMIASPLERDLVEEIERAEPRARVLYDPGLLPPPRFPADHRGEAGFRREEADERRWRKMFERAEVLFGTPGDSSEGLADAARNAPHLRWVQATSAGAGEQARQAGLSQEELERVAVTTAAGVHAGTLAEWSIFGALAFAKSLPKLLRDKQQRAWDHYPTRELRGKTMLVVGLGNIGLETARLARSFGMRVIGTKRNPQGALQYVDELHAAENLKTLVPRADAVVVTLPLTEETRGIVDQETIATMKPECVFVNVGRGGVVDEEALTEALREERILGAALDVFEREPLAADSPLWELDNVLISPHTAALAETENRRIVELFIENLKRYLDGQPLINRVDPVVFY